MRAFYYHEIKGKPQKKNYHLKQIYLPANTPDEKKVSLKKAKEVFKQYQKGVSFSELLQQLKIAPETSDMGYVAQDDLIGPFKKASTHLKNHELSPPFVTQAGVHLIYLVDIKQQALRPFAEMKDEIYKTIYDRKFKLVFDQWIKAKKEETQAYIKIVSPLDL